MKKRNKNNFEYIILRYFNVRFSKKFGNRNDNKEDYSFDKKVCEFSSKIIFFSIILQKMEQQ